MVDRYSKIIIAIAVCLVFVTFHCYAHTDIGDKQINVTMRMIGHEVLLCANDSESRILAIEKDDDRYKIEFSSEFEFNPDDLIPIISTNLKKTGITKNYIVEVEECISKQVIYSYQIGGTNYRDLMPCRGREQPKACYKIFITLLNEQGTSSLIAGNESTIDSANVSNDALIEKKTTNYTTLSLFSIPVLFFIGLFILLMRRKEKEINNPGLTSIGSYNFDEINMQLLHGKDVIELTSKEADLLTLLHANYNNTVEREHILKTVWGDEGDYVGRTLDVFISKLRKKLDGDSNVKIVNIRGVGYKLVKSA